MIIKYLVLDKLTAKLYKANNNGCKQQKDVLEHEASKVLLAIWPVRLSENSYNIFSRIVKKICRLSENQTLFREIVQNDGDILDDENNEIIDNILLDVEKKMTEKMTINDVINKVTNFKNFKPEYN
jgi:hypothetical protein